MKTKPGSKASKKKPASATDEISKMEFPKADFPTKESVKKWLDQNDYSYGRIEEHRAKWVIPGVDAASLTSVQVVKDGEVAITVGKLKSALRKSDAATSEDDADDESEDDSDDDTDNDTDEDEGQDDADDDSEDDDSGDEEEDTSDEEDDSDDSDEDDEDENDAEETKKSAASTNIPGKKKQKKPLQVDKLGKSKDQTRAATAARGVHTTKKSAFLQELEDEDEDMSAFDKLTSKMDTMVARQQGLRTLKSILMSGESPELPGMYEVGAAFRVALGNILKSASGDSGEEIDTLITDFGAWVKKMAVLCMSVKKGDSRDILLDEFLGDPVELEKEDTDDDTDEGDDEVDEAAVAKFVDKQVQKALAKHGLISEDGTIADELDALRSKVSKVVQKTDARFVSLEEDLTTTEGRIVKLETVSAKKRQHATSSGDSEVRKSAVRKEADKLNATEQKLRNNLYGITD